MLAYGAGGLEDADKTGCRTLLAWWGCDMPKAEDLLKAPHISIPVMLTVLHCTAPCHLTYYKTDVSNEGK